MEMESFSDYQSQILIGTILGGSSLIKPPHGVNYYLSMRSQDSRWLEYKMLELPRFYPKIKICKYNTTYRANSICSPKVTSIYNLMYKNKRRQINMKTLDALRDIGIAVWYLENGGKTGRNKKNAYINVTKFGKIGAELVKKYFDEILSISCNLNWDGDRMKIVFSVPGTCLLFKTIAHRFPPFMLNRL